MYNVPMVEVSDDFERCWQVAGLHLQKQAGKNIRWLRDHPRSSAFGASVLYFWKPIVLHSVEGC